MRKRERCVLGVMAAGCATFTPTAKGQLALFLNTDSYTENFNTLASSGTNNSLNALPQGFAAVEAGTGGTLTYTADNGSLATGNTYSYGATGSSERALGEITSGTVNTTMGALVSNQTGSLIYGFTVAYTGEQWRMGAADAIVDRLDFQFSMNATSVVDDAAGVVWTDVNTLDFVSPANTGATGARDGNAAANRTVSFPIAIVPAAPVPHGGLIWFRWLSTSAIGGANDGMAIDDFKVEARRVWTSAVSGSWHSTSNWSVGNIPNGIGTQARLQASQITAPVTVSIDQSTTLGLLDITTANAITFNGSGTLTLDGTTFVPAKLNVTVGAAHKLGVPLYLFDSNTEASISNGVVMTLDGTVTMIPDARLTKTGAGTLIVSKRSANGASYRVEAGQLTFRAAQRLAALEVANAGELKLDAASGIAVRTSSFLLNANGSIDLTDNGLIVNWVDASPLPVLKPAIVSAFSNGAWTGTGIGSTTALSNPSSAVGYAEWSQAGAPATFLGEAVGGNAVLVRWTLKGDADLDGSVTFADLLSLAQNYGLSSDANWVQGDSNYDGQVNFVDLLALAQNYGKAVPGEASAYARTQLAPEPSVGATLAAVALWTAQRRGNRVARRNASINRSTGVRREPPPGIEPGTTGLQNRCSAN